MLSFDVNWWAVLVAVIVNMVIGSLWYSKFLFGERWLKAIGKKMEDLRDSGGPGYAYTTIASVIQAFILANLVRDVSATTAVDGALLGAMIWLGFYAATTITNHVFEGRPWLLWNVNVSYFLIVLVANGIILATWA